MCHHEAHEWIDEYEFTYAYEEEEEAEDPEEQHEDRRVEAPADD